MPLYTIGIVSFFIYTLLKLIFKKTPTAPYPEIKPDPAFRNEVFTTEQYIKRPDSGNAKLVVTAIQGLISAADEQLMKIDSIKKSACNLSKETEDITEIIDTEREKSAEPANGHAVHPVDGSSGDSEAVAPSEADKEAPEVTVKQRDTGAVPKKLDTAEDRGAVKVIPMQKKAAYDASSRPVSPVQSVTLDSSSMEADAAESKCILLDPKVPLTSKVMVADSDLAVETLESSQKSEEETPFDLNLIVVFESVSNMNRSVELNVLLGSEPNSVVRPSAAARVASPTREVVLSGKMKLSLVKLDDNEKKAADGVRKAKSTGSRKNDIPDGSLGPNEE